VGKKNVCGRLECHSQPRKASEQRRKTLENEASKTQPTRNSFPNLLQNQQHTSENAAQNQNPPTSPPKDNLKKESNQPTAPPRLNNPVAHPPSLKSFRSLFFPSIIILQQPSQNPSSQAYA
jgi:hypothetical protein